MYPDEQVFDHDSESAIKWWERLQVASLSVILQAITMDIHRWQFAINQLDPDTVYDLTRNVFANMRELERRAPEMIPWLHDRAMIAANNLGSIYDSLR